MSSDHKGSEPPEPDEDRAEPRMPPGMVADDRGDEWVVELEQGHMTETAAVSAAHFFVLNLTAPLRVRAEAAEADLKEAQSCIAEWERLWGSAVRHREKWRERAEALKRERDEAREAAGVAQATVTRIDTRCERIERERDTLRALLERCEPVITDRRDYLEGEWPGCARDIDILKRLIHDIRRAFRVVPEAGTPTGEPPHRDPWLVAAEQARAVTTGEPHSGPWWKCSGCGHVTSGHIGSCKGYCQDASGKSCDAVPCPKCQRVHYWSGSVPPGDIADAIHQPQGDTDV